MDKRYKPMDAAHDFAQTEEVLGKVVAGEFALPQAVKSLRKLSRLTQPEFAKHRGISIDTLRALESGTGNPTVETINKVVSIFGLEVGLVVKKRGGG